MSSGYSCSVAIIYIFSCILLYGCGKWTYAKNLQAAFSAHSNSVFVFIGKDKGQKAELFFIVLNLQNQQYRQFRVFSHLKNVIVEQRVLQRGTENRRRRNTIKKFSAIPAFELFLIEIFFLFSSFCLGAFVL